jgi:hypothetical protein
MNELIDSAEFMGRLSIKRSKFYHLLTFLCEGEDYAHVGNEYYIFWTKDLLIKLSKSRIRHIKSPHLQKSPPYNKSRINERY